MMCTPSSLQACAIVAASLAMTGLTACEAGHQAGHNQQAAACTAAFAQVKIEDGVDAGEARLLANGYFADFVSGCGGVFELTKTDAGWTATTLVRIGASAGPSISIDANSGSMSCAGRPTITLIGNTVEITP